MYDTLTTTELTVLQNMLFEGTEEVYSVSCAKYKDPDWIGHYRPFHKEIGNLFIEAGTELVGRLDLAAHLS